MSQIIDAMHQHHAELLAGLSEHVRRLVEEPAAADPVGFAQLLTGDLLPHAVGEERHLYPAVDPLIKAHGSATATMSVDHVVITDYIRQIESLATAMAPTAEQRPVLMERLARLGLQLEAVFRLHLRKEEEVYLPLFEQHVSVEAQQRILDGMHAAGAPEEKAGPQVIDVRQIAPPQRHGLIFRTFEALAPGAAFLLVNDHDPKPLHYQFMYERAGQFTWEYEESGPDVWRVRIGKTVDAGAAGAAPAPGAVRP